MAKLPSLLPTHRCSTVKDRIEKIDFQELIFAVVNWPNSELYGAFVYIFMLHWLVCYKPAGQSFPDFGVWVSVDFDSKYKILWGETRDHGVPNHERKKKVQKKNLHNYSKISTPCNIRLKQVWVEGETTLCFLADCSKWTQKWLVVGSSYNW